MFNRTYVSNAPDGGVAMLEVLSDERAWMPFVPLCHVEVSGEVTGPVAGTCDGVLERSPRGSNGFGYDPLFAPDAVPGRTMAELTLEEKNAISHRGNALKALAAQLTESLG